MKREEFEKFINDNASLINEIKEKASYEHDVECNQKYGENLPYSFHLNMVADMAMKYGHIVCFYEHHIIPIIFGAYFHDAIEDARMTYNNVLLVANMFMTEYPC